MNVAPFQSLVNGEFVPANEAALPITDLGVTMGVTLIERLRTFSGQPIFIDRHLDRLLAALPTIGIGPTTEHAPRDQPSVLSRPALKRQVFQLLQRNLPLAREADGQDAELSIGILVTPGTSSLSAVPSERSPTLILTATALKKDQWSSAREQGLALTIVNTREIPSSVIPKHVKHRSRLHYYLADQEAESIEPGSRALLLDTEGFIAESTIGSIVMIAGDRLIAPLATKVLPSVTWNILKDCWSAEPASSAPGFTEANITPAQLKGADEVLWFSSSAGVLPIASIDGQPIGDPNVDCTQRPGYQKFLQRWHVQLSESIV